MFIFLRKISSSIRVVISLFRPTNFIFFKFRHILAYLSYISLDTLFVIIITSFFISLVLSLQIVKEFLYLNASHLVAPMLAISFVRELSPVLTSIVAISKVGSFFTAEIGTMVVTEQIDSMFILGINPVAYLFLPRIFSLFIILPLLNLFSLFTSLISSSFICFCLYGMSPGFFFESLAYNTILTDFLKSLLKLAFFSLIISIISCVWGISTPRGSTGVGLSTTSAVVTSLVFVFMINFILSYLLFDNNSSSLTLL